MGVSKSPNGKNKTAFNFTPPWGEVEKKGFLIFFELSKKSKKIEILGIKTSSGDPNLKKKLKKKKKMINKDFMSK